MHRVVAPALALLVLAACAAATPYAGRAMGIEIGVDVTTEVVDHVLPAVVVTGAAVILARAAPGSLRAVWSAAAVLLGGLLNLVSHLPLLTQAGRPPVTWGEALFHSATGVPLVAAGLVLFGREVRRL